MSVEEDVLEICKKRAGIDWEYYSVSYMTDEYGKLYFIQFNEQDMVDGQLVPTGKSKGAKTR